MLEVRENGRHWETWETFAVGDQKWETKMGDHKPRDFDIESDWLILAAPCKTWENYHIWSENESCRIRLKFTPLMQISNLHSIFFLIQFGFY